MKYCTTELFQMGLVVLSHQVHETLTNYAWNFLYKEDLCSDQE